MGKINNYIRMHKYQIHTSMMLIGAYTFVKGLIGNLDDNLNATIDYISDLSL